MALRLTPGATVAGAAPLALGLRASGLVIAIRMEETLPLAAG